MPIAEPLITWLAGGAVSVTGAPTERMTLWVPPPMFLGLAVVDEGQVVADAVQVGSDVRGEQDTVSLVDDEVPDDAEERVTGGSRLRPGTLQVSPDALG